MEYICEYKGFTVNVFKGLEKIHGDRCQIVFVRLATVRPMDSTLSLLPLDLAARRSVISESGRATCLYCRSICSTGCRHRSLHHCEKGPLTMSGSTSVTFAPIAAAGHVVTQQIALLKRPGTDSVSLMRSFQSANDNYSGKIADSSYLKLNIFYDRCTVGIAESDRFPLLSVMQCGTSLSSASKVLLICSISFL